LFHAHQATFLGGLPRVLGGDKQLGEKFSALGVEQYPKTRQLDGYLRR
jgi:hypothetical protein